MLPQSNIRFFLLLQSNLIKTSIIFLFVPGKKCFLSFIFSSMNHTHDIYRLCPSTRNFLQREINNNTYFVIILEEYYWLDKILISRGQSLTTVFFLQIYNFDIMSSRVVEVKENLITVVFL